MYRWCAILLLAVGLVGCSADSYRRSADAQVGRILEQRIEPTLGYEPQIEVPTERPPPPTRRSYRRLPVTPIAPPMPSPLEVATDFDLDHGELGPRQLPLDDSLDHEAFGASSAQRRAAEGLRLGPPAPDDRPMRLDLFDAVDYAVQYSRTYRTQMEDLYLSALTVTLERHLLSPRPFVQTGLEVRGAGSNQDYAAALAATGSAGVRQRLPYGGEIVARTLVEFVNTLHGPAADAESASIILSGSVPLLRGAGMVNLEGLVRSERRLIYQIRSFEEFRRQFAVNVASQYFNLLTLQQRLNNRRVNYANLLTLTARAQAMFEAGRISFLEVQRSAQALLVAQNALIDAQDSYQSAVDRFKILIGMPVEQEVEIVGVELQVDIPEVDIDDAIAIALAYRLDLQTARDQIEDARRAVDHTRRGLLPDLNLHGQARVRNPPGTPALHIDEGTLTYAAGATLDLPVDRLPERNVYRRALIDFERAQRAYEELSERIAIAARDALRAIESAQVTLEIQRRAIDLAERRLEYSTELLEMGRIRDARNVVEAQGSLLAAQDAYARAKADLQIQVLQYLRDTGTLRIDPEAGSLGRALERRNPQDDPLGGP